MTGTAAPLPLASNGGSGRPLPGRRRVPPPQFVNELPGEQGRVSQVPSVDADPRPTGVERQARPARQLPRISSPLPRGTAMDRTPYRRETRSPVS